MKGTGWNDPVVCLKGCWFYISFSVCRPIRKDVDFNWEMLLQLLTPAGV